MEAVVAAPSREHHLPAGQGMLSQHLGATGRHPGVIEGVQQQAWRQVGRSCKQPRQGGSLPVVTVDRSLAPAGGSDSGIKTADRAGAIWPLQGQALSVAHPEGICEGLGAEPAQQPALIHPVAGPLDLLRATS